MRGNTKKRDQRLRETYFRQSRRKAPEVITLGAIGERLKKDVSRTLLALE